MSKVLFIKSSILGDESKSGSLLSHAAELYQEKGARVSVRDLAEQPVSVLDGELAAGLRGGERLNARQSLASYKNTCFRAINTIINPVHS